MSRRTTEQARNERPYPHEPGMKEYNILYEKPTSAYLYEYLIDQRKNAMYKYPYSLFKKQDGLKK